MISGGLALAVLTACAPAPDGADGAGSPTSGAGVERLGVEVVEQLPHDPEAFTQGLEIAGATLYEGTGLVGGSSVRAGPVGGEPEIVRPLPEPLFGEGLTVVGDRVWQLTWQAGVAIERDRDTLAEQRRVRYDGEGWGLCHREEADELVMSDGSARLTFRDPEDFSVTGSVTVTESGTELAELNELECVGDAVYANVWHSDVLRRIDVDSGRVTARIDASGLLTPDERADADVLNGVAKYPGSDQFLLTGKLWPTMFRVRFVPQG